MTKRILSAFVVLAGLMMVEGCCCIPTPEYVATLQGHGAKRAFDVNYETAWTTTRTVAVMADLNVLSANRKTGYISARRPMGETTFGDVVGIWVRPIAPNQTQVEVVSRPVGPPVPFAPDEEEAILKSLEDVFTF